MKCTKSHDEAVAETKCLLGDDVEPRHPSNNATEILQCIMSKLGPGGLWELLRVPPGQWKTPGMARDPKFSKLRLRPWLLQLLDAKLGSAG